MHGKKANSGEVLAEKQTVALEINVQVETVSETNKVTNVAPSKPLIKKKITSRGDYSAKKQNQIHKDYIKKGKDEKT